MFFYFFILTQSDFKHFPNFAQLVLHECTLSVYFKCRYTLQYTYPYAYYMESGPRKKLVRSKLLFLFFIAEHIIYWYHFPDPPSLSSKLGWTLSPLEFILSPIMLIVTLIILVFLSGVESDSCSLVIIHLSFSAVWVPAGPAGGRDRKPVVEGGAGRQLWERSGGRRGGA